MPTQEQLNKLLFAAVQRCSFIDVSPDVQRRDLDQVLDLISKGADVNAIDKDNYTPLSCVIKKHWDKCYSKVAAYKISKIVRLLIANGARMEQEEAIINVKKDFINQIRQLGEFINFDEFINELLTSFQYQKMKDSYVEHSFEKPNREEVKMCDLKKISDADNKVAIISAESGAGKTAALTDLAKQTSVSVLMVRLTEHSSNLFNISSNNINLDNAIDFLCDNKNLDDIVKQKLQRYHIQGGTVGELLLESIIKQELIRRYKNQDKIIIVLDGFEDIAPDYEEKAIKLVRTLKDTEKVEKIWITTRPHIQSKLEEEFCVSSYRLRPFSKKDQMEFYKKFCDNSQIDYDTMNRLLNSFFNSIKDPSWEFGKIPLHAQMIAEALSGGKLVNNLSSLYKRFVEEKYKVYYEEKRGSNLSNVAVKCSMKRSTESYAESYSNLALNELFDEDKIKPFINKDAIKLDSALKQGFIRIVDGKVSFIHRAFAEYAAADLFFRAIKFQKDDMKKYKLVCDFLHKHIFKVDSEVFCKFLDYKLAEASEIHTLVLNNDVSKVHDLLSKEGGSVIDSVDLLGRTPLHLAAFYSCKEAVKLLLEKGAKLDIKDKFGLTPLKYAEKNGDKDIIDLLKVAQKVANLTGSDSTNTTSEEADARMQTGNDEKLQTETTANPTNPSSSAENKTQNEGEQSQEPVVEEAHLEENPQEPEPAAEEIPIPIVGTSAEDPQPEEESIMVNLPVSNTTDGETDAEFKTWNGEKLKSKARIHNPVARSGYTENKTQNGSNSQTDPQKPKSNSKYYIVGCAIGGAIIGAVIAHFAGAAVVVFFAAAVVGALLGAGIGYGISYGISKCFDSPDIQSMSDQAEKLPV